MNFESTKNVQIVPPYTKLALIYDDVMRFVDYRGWANYVERLIGQWRPNARTILDLACGTGNLLLQLDSRKYKRYGCDLSLDMLRVALLKGCRFPLCQADMTALPLRWSPDVIICLYDSINYLLDLELWKKSLTAIRASLNDNGIFIFDICTERNSQKYFHNYIEKERRRNYSYIRESTYDSETRIHRNTFTMNFDAERLTTYIEYHRQFILRIDEVLALIEQSGLEMMGAYHEFTFHRANANSLRIHFVVKKK
ncbi:MAG: methyltransferase domain-containing protein [candidate division KSB1 bacterium]|nr:methyltransferase domain-containing protein [candidate division KSB1 bacterium]MDZ7340502.1 methyltransferase domain-containing protein [candidate division KSB1 bacterium]